MFNKKIKYLRIFIFLIINLYNNQYNYFNHYVIIFVNYLVIT